MPTNSSLANVVSDTISLASTADADKGFFESTNYIKTYVIHTSLYTGMYHNIPDSATLSKKRVLSEIKV